MKFEMFMSRIKYYWIFQKIMYFALQKKIIRKKLQNSYK